MWFQDIGNGLGAELKGGKDALRLGKYELLTERFDQLRGSEKHRTGEALSLPMWFGMCRTKVISGAPDQPGPGLACNLQGQDQGG